MINNKHASRRSSFIHILIISLLLFLKICLAGCSQTLASKSEIALDTVCTITLYEYGKPRVYERIFERLLEIESLMSVYITGTELDRINSAAGLAPVKVSPDVFEVIERALYFARLTGGAFDPAIGPIVSLWDIGGENQKVPSRDEIEILLPLIDWNDIELDRLNSTVFLKKQGMALNLGAIAKGFAADEAAAIIRNEQIPRAIIDLGGNILLVGEKPDSSPWNIGIQNPLDNQGEFLGIVRVSQQTNQKTVVTSGIYQRYFIENDVLYHHLFSTVEGFPVSNNLLSVTIITDSSMDADALSTAVFVMGYEDGRALVESLENVDCVFVFDDQLIRVTGDVDFVLTNGNYRIIYD